MVGDSVPLVTNANDLAIKLKPDNKHGIWYLSTDGTNCGIDVSTGGKKASTRGHGDAGKGRVEVTKG